MYANKGGEKNMEKIISWFNGMSVALFTGLILAFLDVHVAHWYLGTTVAGISVYALSMYLFEQLKKTEC